MNSRWKWICVLSILSLLVWACSKEEETASKQQSKEPPATVEKSEVDQTAAEKTDAARGETASVQMESDKGEEVYRQSCAACHDQGIAGAPRLTDRAEWEQRLQKGMETLNEHAINGFQGEKGMMPAKGGNPELTDQEVREAVDYMVAEATEGGK